MFCVLISHYGEWSIIWPYLDFQQLILLTPIQNIISRTNKLITVDIYRIMYIYRVNSAYS